MKNVFVNLKIKNVPFLIIDITGNKGGSDLVWGALSLIFAPNLSVLMGIAYHK
jgi:hypothetical protein